MRTGALRGLIQSLKTRPGRRRGLGLVLLAVAASIAAPVVVGGAGVFHHLIRLPIWVLLGAPALMLVAWVANAGRVILLLHANGRRIGFGRAWLVAAGGDFGAALGPGGLTGIAAYVFLLGRSGLDSATSTALFALEKLLDQLIFAAALAASTVVLVLYGRGPRPWGLFEVGFGVSGGVCLLLLLLIFQYRRLVGWIAWPLARLRRSRHHQWRFIRWSLQFRRGVVAVATLPRRRLVLLAFCAAAYWAPRFAILPLVAVGTRAPVPWGYLLSVQVLALFAGQLSLLPGGTITVEAVFAAMLLPWVNRAEVGLMLLVWRGSVFYFTLVAGGAAFLAEAARRRPSPATIREPS